MNLSLRRTETGPDGTFGQLYMSGVSTLYTVEDDWKDNEPRESCIPAGIYKLHRTVFLKHGYETFEVLGVPNRSRILIHPANTEEDVEGCIGVGLRQGTLRVRDEDDPRHPIVYKKAVVASREAFQRFMTRMLLVDEAMLTVEWTTPFPKAA